MLVFIIGMLIQPSTAPAHHIGRPFPRDRIKFSVLIAKRRVLHITRTLLLGGGSIVAAILPKSIAAPEAVVYGGKE